MIRFPDKFTSPRPIDNGTATIEGRIVDGNGIGIPHAGVMLRQDDKAIVSLSDAAGRWAFQKIPAGSFTIGLARSGSTPPRSAKPVGPSPFALQPVREQKMSS